MQQVGHGDVPGLHAGGVDGGGHLPVPVAALLPQHRHPHLHTRQCQCRLDRMAWTWQTETSSVQASNRRCTSCCCNVSSTTALCAFEAAAVGRVPSSKVVRTSEAAGADESRRGTLFWAASFSGGVHSGVKGRRHCGAVWAARPLCSSATVASAACSRSSRKPVSSQTSRSSGVVPAWRRRNSDGRSPACK